MPPKSLRQTQLKRKRPSSSTPAVPTPTYTATPTIAASSASAPCPSTAAPPSPTATATPSQSAGQCSPSLTATTTSVPPPLLSLTATEGESSMAMVTGSTSLATEAPRSIRCRNKDGIGKSAQDNVRQDRPYSEGQGGKLKVDFSPFHKGPGQKDRYDSYVRDLGAGVREVVPMLANTWGKLKPEHRAPLTDYMQMYYDVPASPEMEEFFKKKASSVYKEWKYDCHMHYLEFGGEDIPLEFVQRPEQWRWLVKNDFEDEKQQAICERKKKQNRTKNPSPINHHNGPVPISFRAEALMKEKHPAGIIQVCINVYEPCQNAKDRVKHVEEILQAREGEGDAPEEQEPVSVEQ